MLGEHEYTDTSETEHLRMDVSQINNHPDYDSSTTDYDFAMLKFATAVDFASYPHIRPACLPSDDSNTYAGETATVTGWGTTSSGGSVSSSLREAFKIPTINNIS